MVSIKCALVGRILRYSEILCHEKYLDLQPYQCKLHSYYRNSNSSNHGKVIILT